MLLTRIKGIVPTSDAFVLVNHVQGKEVGYLGKVAGDASFALMHKKLLTPFPPKAMCTFRAAGSKGHGSLPQDPACC